MEQIIARKTKEFEPGKFVDHYQAAVRELIDQKLEGKMPVKPAEHRPAQVIDLMEALKRSLAEEQKSPSGAPRRAASRPAAVADSPPPASRGRKTAAPSGQRSLLLPVDGGRGQAPRSAPATRGPAPAEAPKRRRKAS